MKENLLRKVRKSEKRKVKNIRKDTIFIKSNVVKHHNFEDGTFCVVILIDEGMRIF